MEEALPTIGNGIEERRTHRGTWYWFVLNVLLFPAPAHFTLLRVREFTLGKSLRHIAVTLLLALVLIAAAAFQLLFSQWGRLWMVFPLLSGLAVLYAKRSSRNDFEPLELASARDNRVLFLPYLLLILTLLSVMPALDLIELNAKSTVAQRLWIERLPYWQEVLILIPGLALLLFGYATNASTPLSINRAFVLYACFVVLLNQILLGLVLAFGWLKIQGAFGTRFVAILLAAILALDYWDARSFGQYTRRYFFLTCTKGISFVFLWLSLFGLPQKAASAVSSYYYARSRPGVTRYAPQYLVFDERDRFRTAHEASRRLRSLYTKAFMSSDKDAPERMVRLLRRRIDATLPADTDVARLTEKVGGEEIRSTSMAFGKVPLFRPVHPDWDVMLTALLWQRTISQNDLDKFIAGFKTTLPKGSMDRLPDLDSPYEARYVAMATGTRAEFLPPRYDLVEALVEKGFCPVLSLRLAGKDCWTALLHLDRKSGIAWLSVELLPAMEGSIQLLFDSDESRTLREEILSRSLVPASLDYLQGALDDHSNPVIVFSREGIGASLPDLFSNEDLAEVERALRFCCDPEHSDAPSAQGARKGLFSGYAAYLRTISSVKAKLEPEPYDQEVIFRPPAESSKDSGAGRLREIDALLVGAGPLRDADRIDIAYLMVKHDHTYAAPNLFVRLAARRPFSSDLIDCRAAFMIGRQLFLHGYPEEAYGYLELSFLRHPFDTEYEMWHHIASAKVGKPLFDFYSPPDHEPQLALYYQTLVDIGRGDRKRALKRLEMAIKKDSHNSVANHLLNRYFNRTIDERYFFPSQRGL